MTALEENATLQQIIAIVNDPKYAETPQSTVSQMKAQMTVDAPIATERSSNTSNSTYVHPKGGGIFFSLNFGGDYRNLG